MQVTSPIAYAQQAPAALKPQATAQAAEVMMAKKGLDMIEQQGQAAMKLLDSASLAAATGVGTQINTYA